jgi:hypothetical protein
MELSFIRTILILALIVSLGASLIAGFLNVAHQLLSRKIFVTPFFPSRERADESCDETGQA